MESKEGEGTTFTLELPFSSAQDETAISSDPDMSSDRADATNNR
jgi:hypothetical protein